LKKELAQQARVLRDGTWKVINAAGLVEQAKTVSHFQKAVLTIGNYQMRVRFL